VKLSVRLYAGLRERAGLDRVDVDVSEGATLGELKRELARLRPELGALDHVAGVVGTDWVDDARVLRAGDDLHLLPPVSGGAPDSDADLARGVFELCPEPLDPGEAQARVAHAECGGTALFTGSTRATNAGKSVLRLEYEAFERMAGPEMARIFERSKLLLFEGERVRMLVQHRVGRVAAGEPSVIVAVASPHRDAAFRVCRFLIDDLKRSLPIWKKEVCADGHAWVGDRP
jgi:molybdopterin synthase catalytic subunit